ncbi:MAG: hypothetical protein AABX07_02825, partial [Nanoarchaeota archaeon]
QDYHTSRRLRRANLYAKPFYCKRLPNHELNLGVNKSKEDKYCFAAIRSLEPEKNKPRAFMKYDFNSETFGSDNHELILDYEDYFFEPLAGNNKQGMVDYLFAEAIRRLEGQLPMTDFRTYRPLSDKDLLGLGIRSMNIHDITLALFNFPENDWRIK